MANDIFDSMLGEVQEGTFAPSPELEKPEEQDPIFGELLQREASKTQEQGYIAAVRGQRANPDGYAEDNELAKTFGVPVDFVGRNRDRLKSFKGIQDAQRLFDADPVLGQFYASGDNADAIKIDELRQFSGMQWLAMAAGSAFKSGRADVNLANARYAELMGTASGEQIRAADLMSQGRDGRTFGADSWLEKGWAGTFQQLPNMIETLLGGVDQGIKGAIGGATIAAVAGQLGPQVALPEEVLTVPAGAAAGYKVGAVAGQLKASFRLQSGLAFDEFKNMKDADGRPMDQDVAKGAALISGATGAILETIGFQAMAKLVPGLDKVAGHLTVDGVKSAIARPTVAAALKTFAQNVAKSGATEVTTEVLQEGIQIFAGEMAKSIANGEGADFAFMSSDDITGRLADSFEQTLQTMTIMGPALSGTRLGLDVRRARQASSDAAVIQALNDHAQGNELNARLPEKAKEVVRTLTENGPVKTVYVNPTAFSTFFQTSEEIGAYAAEIGITDEYNEASRTGRDMEIPIDVYYSSIAGTEIGQAIRDFVKLDPDRMDMNEAAAFNEAWAEAAQEISTQAERDYLTQTAAVTAVEEIQADVKERAMNAGIVPDQAEQYAKLYSTFFRVMGDRTGQDPGEVYRKYGFEIRRAIPGWDNEYKPVDGLNISLEAIRKGAVAPLRKRVEKSKGASLLDAVKARGGIDDAGGDLASLNAPKGIIRKGTAGQASMLSGGDNQYSADDVARQMWEEGYFPEFEDRPTANDLIDAIAEEMGGTKRFKAQVTRDPAVERAEALVTFADELDRLGLDPNRMTDDDIRAELERIIADDPNTGALYQAAFHGSPHRFDKFSLDHIGSGEGAQAYGWGLYFAGRKEIAEFYREVLSETQWHWYEGDRLLSGAEENAARILLDQGTKEDAIEWVNNLRGGPLADTAYLDATADAINSLDLSAVREEKDAEQPGRLFEVDIPDDAELLVWEKSLSEQPEGVRAAIEEVRDVYKSFAPTSNALDGDMRFAQFYMLASSEPYGTPEQLSRDLVAAGVPGHRYLDATSRGEGDGSYNYVIYDDSRVAVREYYQEGTQEGEQAAGVKRGSIQFGEGRTIINMFEAANPSTFLHESGHFFLEVFRDLAVQEGGTGTVSADWLVAKEYLGITDDAAISVEAHEKFARSFEAYLFEGKAPSNEVTGIFSRFRSWLVFVYQSVSNLNVPINDKIRGVMDRLVATDEEIRLAQTGSDFRPQFASAEEAGMSPAQWKDYVEVAGRAVEKATRELSTRMLQDVRRETSTEWRNAKREIRAQVAEEFGRLPVYQVINYLRTGKTTMLPETMQRVYLDRDSIVEVMGEGALLKMPKSVPPLYRAAAGLHADSLAEMFGYPSGHEMLTNIMSARPLNRAIVEETDLRMRQRFGDLMGDAVARAREVSAAIDNDATGELLMAEMEVLMKKGLVTTKLRKQDAQRVAREAVRGKNIREAVRVKLYQNANLRAAQEVEKAIIAGDWKAAVAAKQRQVLNHFMAVEAREAEKDTENAVRYLNKFAGRTRPKGIDPEYLDQIEGVLERFDLRKSISLKGAQRRNSLAAWIQEQEAQGHIVDVPDVLRRDAFRKPYKEMTVDDLLAVRDAVKNIEHLGRLKDKLLSNKEQREFLGARDEMLAALEAHQDKRKEPSTRNPTPVMLALETARSLEASQLKMEQVFDWMDGGDVNGPFNRYIWRPIAKAEARESELRAEYAAKLAVAFEKLDKERLSARITIPGVAQTFRRSEIMAIALNMGNASNLDKMLRGEGWTQEILDRAVANLNDAEWDTVQEVWDTINTLWPEIAALQKRLAGVVPPKVEARKFVTPTGKEMKGGYYPAIYDPRRSADVEDRAAANADLFIENTYLRPDTPRGFTKERAQMYARPMLFDLDAIGNHINGVIHDLTHREAIMDAVKFITNGAVRNEIETRYGKAIYQQITPWLQSIAKDMQPNEGLNAVNKVFRSVRSRATMVAMGFRVSTMLAQVAGLSSSAEMVPVKQLAGAIKDFGMNPAAMWREVDSLSGEMKYRMQTLDRDIKERLRELTGATSATDRARRFAFYGIGYLDRAVTVPTWMAAYRDHLSRYPTDKEGAIAHADKVIRLTQGSGGAKDLSALQRRNELTKLVTMFYSYFAAYYNRQRNWGRDAARAVKAGDVREFPQLLARQVFMTIGPALLGEMLTGKGPEEDEDWEKWALRKVALYPVAAVPIARDFANYFNNGFDYSFTPIERTLNDMVVKPIELVGDIVEGEADARKASKVVINGAGLWFNLPTGQLATSVDNVWRAIEEDDFQLRDIVLTRPAK